MIKIALLLLLSLQLFSLEYIVNPRHSYVEFGVKNMLLPYTKGLFKEFRGTFTYDEERDRFISLEGEADPATVDTQSKMRDEHLRSADFFDVKRYPVMKLHLVRQFQNKLFTKLTIKGITQNVIFTLSDNKVGKDDKLGNHTRVFTLKATIVRQDFNIKYNAEFGPGEMLIENNVDITLFLEGIEIKPQEELSNDEL